MSFDWAIYSLGDVASFKTGKLDSNAAEENGRFPFFTCAPQTLSINSYDFDAEAVLLAGNNANGIFCCKHYSGKFNAYQRTYVIEPLDNEIVSCKYLYFFISHKVNHLKELSVGSATKFLTKTILNAIPVRLPPRVEQDRIATLLSALDDRITLLRETNATLEAIAQALFKSWFVDFDPVRAKQEGRVPDGMDPATAALFPDAFEESELGLVPRGWRVGAFGDLATLVKGSVNPLNSPAEVFEHYSLPAFDSSQLPVCELGETIKSNKTRMCSGVVLQSKLNPHIPRVWFPLRVGAQAVCSTEFLPWLAKAPASPEILYCLLISSAFEARVRTLVTGTSNSHQRVKPEQVGALPVAVATNSIYETFTEQVRPLLQRVGENLESCKLLSALRDTLLPRLISGQLRLPEAEAEALAA